MSATDNSFVRRVIVIDDNAAIHRDFRKILCDAEDAAQVEELGQMASQLFGAAAPAGSEKLRRLSYQVDAAEQGQKGLEQVVAALEQGCPFQVAFVDIRMPPGWDGIETIQRLWEVDPSLQTVICSAYSDYSFADIRRRLGDSDRLLILKKPFDTAEICQMAAALTEKYRLVRMASMKLEELEKLVDERTAALTRTNEQLEMEVQQRRYAEECLRHDVLHDRLTSLPNRLLLEERVEQCLKQQRRDAAYCFGVLFADVDDFKVVNDSLGHEAGDKLLVEIGRRLSSAVRSVDATARFTNGLASRLGGDEFVILLDGLARTDDAQIVADRIHRVMAEPFELNGYEVVANLSMGIATSRVEYTRAADILRDADTAVYRAKANGKHGCAVFDTAMRDQAKGRLELEMELRKGVGTEQFHLHYQPIVSLKDGRLQGFEALLRWDHPQQGKISPARFIPLAEVTGLIMPLGMQVLREAASQIRQWHQQFPERPDLWVSVNLSGRQLHCADFPEQIKRTLDELGVDPSAVHFEITESVLMQQGDTAMTTLSRLRDMGYSLYMDDFGTGYSSLSHLHQLPIACIKVDQSFVKKLTAEGRSYAATVQAIVMLAHNCGFPVIAEGVETADQHAELVRVGCDSAQGFLFSKPVSPGMIPALMNQSLVPAIKPAPLRQAS